MKAVHVLMLVMVVALVWCIYEKMRKEKQMREGIGGFGVTSGLSMYNRSAICSGPSGAYGGGCSIPHRVII